MVSFTYTPDFGAVKNSKPSVVQIKFGDGYEQRQPVGINTNPKNWDLKFVNRTDSEAAAIESFLDTQGGQLAFDWIPPGDTNTYKFVCRSWTRSMDKPNLNTVTAMFEQVYEP